jgi:POT family proton-dependent oligopeptide transporter
LDSYSYFSLSIILTLFLSEDFGYTDIQAGTIYGAWGALITIYGLATGFIVDNLGVAASLRLGFLMSLISRCFLFFTTSRAVFLWNICLLLPLGNCMGIPVLTTGIRRYTHEGNRGFAYGLFYVIMNVAALLSGPIVDYCTIAYKDTDAEGGGNGDEHDEEAKEYTPKEWSLTGYRLVVLTGVISNIIAVFVTLTVREIKLGAGPPDLKNAAGEVLERPAAEDESESETEDNEQATIDPLTKDGIASSKDATISTFTPLKGSAWSILKETMTKKSFWRFIAVCLITLNVRMIFRHLDATLPKYMVREFGENVKKGSIYSINPALIIVLVPLVTAATSHVDPLVMIHYGSYISTASVFFLAVSTSVTACILFVIVLSIGEAVWSPRLYDYTMNVCPEGREGTYMALSSAPLFLAKLPVGFMSGYLLHEYCPEEGPRNSKMMWFIIGITTAVSPILLTACWKCISYKDKDDEHDGEYGQESNIVCYAELSEQHLASPGEQQADKVVLRKASHSNDSIHLT